MAASALIVIDMQVGSFTDETPRHDADGLVARLNSLAERVRQNAGLVIFIRHDGPAGDPHHPSLPGWHILPDLSVLPADEIVAKTACDAFLDTTLENVLRAHEVDRLIVTGCATDYCVDTTVRSALAREYDTIAPSDGHTTADRPHLNARAIIEHHNAIWADFIAPGGPARVCRCDEVEF
ncbi:MAG: isochorismatase family protein [Alphaproteobacteria bacterium]|jgi:nicotinamidase-related amidase|nr:isochorismatase family protein [Alphaproteobacteria bacterium]